MFFTLSKLFWIAASPANALIGLALAGVALGWTRWWRAGRMLTGGALLTLLACGILPVAAALVRPIEDRFPTYRDDGRPIDGIVILGGAVGLTRGEVSLTKQGARMTEAVALARRHPQARIVFTGGSGELLPDDDTTEADGAKRLFAGLGLAPERLVFEDRSRNTRENALFTSALVVPKPGERWLLVTSAFHMPRAMGCFRAVGWEPIAYPVDFLTEGDSRDYTRVSRATAGGLALLDLVAKEWIGLIAYRLAGYTPELLPGP